MVFNPITRVSFPATLLTLALCYTNFINCTAGQTTETTRLDSLQFYQVAGDYLKGKQIFSKFCIGCHAPLERRVTDQYVFDNLFDRLPKPPEEYFRKFIQDSRKMKDSGDKQLQELAKEFSSNYDSGWF
jgi:hypothetical protein